MGQKFECLTRTQNSSCANGVVSFSLKQTEYIFIACAKMSKTLLHYHTTCRTIHTLKDHFINVHSAGRILALVAMMGPGCGLAVINNLSQVLCYTRSLCFIYRCSNTCIAILGRGWLKN